MTARTAARAAAVVLSIAVSTHVGRAVGPTPRQTAPQTTAQATPPQQPFDEWLAALERDALAQGVSQATLDAALAHLAPDPDVIAHDRTQPEQVQTLDDYVAARLSEKTRETALSMAKTHAALLDRVAGTYGVPAPVLVAIWGLESNFGQITGTHPVIASLVTLAYDSRRPALFRGELLQALQAIDRGLARPEDLKGSWAGAMGQPQFMPSSYLKYAVDFDGDGRPNIWTSIDAVLASMANYLARQGWTAGERWGREVQITPDVLARIDQAVPLRSTGCKARKEMTEQRPLDTWASLGVVLPGGDAKPAGATEASLVRGANRYFLVYHNYEAIIDYNCANPYAVSVGLLSDLVAAH